MRIQNKQLKDFLLDSNLLDKEKVEGSFKEAEEKIRQYLTNQKLKQRVDEYLNEVKKTAKIERIPSKAAN